MPPGDYSYWADQYDDPSWLRKEARRIEAEQHRKDVKNLLAQYHKRVDDIIAFQKQCSVPPTPQYVHYDVDPRGIKINQPGRDSSYESHILCKPPKVDLEFTFHVENVTCPACNYLLGEITHKVNEAVARSA